MEFEAFNTQVKDLDEKIKLANDKLANAESEQDQQDAISEIENLNNQKATLKDNFIEDTNKAYIELSKKYEKTEQERLQALKIASDNANKKPPEEKDPRKIIRAGFGGY